MNNMRRGFTMIELIFVIVIIGILAAVAIPKLAGTAKEAKKSIYTSFMGTMNRSVGPAMWAEKVITDKGSITGIGADDVLTFTELPAGLDLDTLSACADPGSLAVGTGEVGAIEADDSGLDADELIYCINGTPTQAPSFGYGVVDGNETNKSLQAN